MTTSTGEPAAGSLALKTFRIRKCGIKLFMPGGLTFVCQLEKHTPDIAHKEVGFVMMPNNTAREYEISWTDRGVSALRQNRHKKVRHHTK